MSHNIVTECPACTTRFQVTQGQLKIANGKVRCGSCLEIFNAEVYRCDDLTTPLKDLSQKDLLNKDPLFDQIEVPAFAPPQRSPSGFDKRYTTPGQDELLAEQLNSDAVDDDSVELEQPIQGLIKTEETSHQEPVSEQTTVKLISDNPVAHTAAQTALPCAEETELEKPQPQPFETATEFISKVLPTESGDEKQSKTAQISEQPTAETAGINTYAPLSEPASITPPLTTFRPEPVMIRTTREESPSWVGWTLFVLLALLMLAAQALWFNRQQFSAYPELTSGYRAACAHLPCDLKTPIILHLINTRKLVIQQHAEYQGALSVNLLLENRADYSQPFPAIQLSFSNRRGELISQRIFQPIEYLKNTQTEPMSMPVGKPVQISFDILDPGRRALSYEALLKVPTTSH